MDRIRNINLWDKLVVLAWILTIPYIPLAYLGLGAAWIFGVPVLLIAFILYCRYQMDAPSLKDLLK